MTGITAWLRWGLMAVGLIVLTLAAGCEAPGGAFLGWPDDQARKIEDEQPHADPQVRGQVTMTEVRTVPYETYVAMRSAGQVMVEERRSGQVYFAVRRTMQVPIAGRPGLAPAMIYVGVMERYRAGVPEEVVRE